MRSIAFQLSRENLSAYQFAVRDRLQNRKRQGMLNQPVVLWLVIMGGVFLITVFGVEAFERSTGRRMEMMEFFLGMGVGLVSLLAIAWLHYLDQRRGIAGAEGPLLSPQTIRVSAECVETVSKAGDARFRWSAIEAIAQERGLIIFWIEPGAGLAVPADAVGSPGEQAAFIANAEAYRVAASCSQV